MQVLDAPLLQPLRNRTTAPDRLIGWWSTQGLPLGWTRDVALIATYADVPRRLACMPSAQRIHDFQAVGDAVG